MPVEIIEDLVNGDNLDHFVKTSIKTELKRQESQDNFDPEKRDRTKSDLDKSLKDDQKEVFVKLLTRFLRYLS